MIPSTATRPRHFALALRTLVDGSGQTQASLAQRAKLAPSLLTHLLKGRKATPVALGRLLRAFRSPEAQALTIAHLHDELAAAGLPLDFVHIRPASADPQSDPATLASLQTLATAARQTPGVAALLQSLAAFTLQGTLRSTPPNPPPKPRPRRTFRG